MREPQGRSPFPYLPLWSNRRSSPKIRVVSLGVSATGRCRSRSESRPSGPDPGNAGQGSEPPSRHPFPLCLACFHLEGRRPMTQLEAARKGVVTDEMHYVAQREDLDPELIRDEVARGRMVIPANTVHLAKTPRADGHRRRQPCARSTPTSATRPSPARSTTSWRSCTPPSTSAPTPSWTCPPAATSTPSARPSSTPRRCRSAPCRSTRSSRTSRTSADITPRMMLDMVEHQAKQGVDYMTIHAGVLLEYLPLTTQPHHRHRQPRRLADRRSGCWPATSRTRGTRTSTSCARSCGPTT